MASDRALGHWDGQNLVKHIMTVNGVSQTIVKHDVSEIASLTRLTPEAGLSDPGGHRVNTNCALPPETSSIYWPERRWGSSSGSFPASATLRSPPRRKKVLRIQYISRSTSPDDFV